MASGGCARTSSQPGRRSTSSDRPVWSEWPGCAEPTTTSGWPWLSKPTAACFDAAVKARTHPPETVVGGSWFRGPVWPPPLRAPGAWLATEALAPNRPSRGAKRANGLGAYGSSEAQFLLVLRGAYSVADWPLPSTPIRPNSELGTRVEAC